MLFQITPSIDSSSIDFIHFKTMSINDLVKIGKIELEDLDQPNFIITFRAKNQRMFLSTWKNYGFRHVTCTGVRNENTISSSFLKCLNHEIGNRKCSYYSNFFPQERLTNMSISDDILNKQNQSSEHFGRQQYIDDSHLPQYSAIINYENNVTTNLDLLHDLRRSIIPILKDKDIGRIIVGTSFYIQFDDCTYIVSAKHVLVNSNQLIDYIFGFEGNILNEIYFLKRETLKQTKFSWTWLDIQGDIELDIIVSKVIFTEELIQKLGLKPIMVDLADFKIGPGDEVRSFGFPHGYGEDTKNLFYFNKDKHKLGSDIITLIPLSLKGHLLDIHEQKGVVNLTSNLAAGKGLSGSPLIHIKNGIGKLLGINYAGPIAITDKKGLREGKSLKKTTKYASKMKTVHVGHLINLLQSPNVASREPVIIGIEHLKTEYRDLSIVNSDSKTIS